tara:strand:- start:714 stop:1256 length:543 start_codon:yes stop_codon:yes gene_type:complete
MKNTKKGVEMEDKIKLNNRDVESIFKMQAWQESSTFRKLRGKESTEPFTTLNSTPTYRAIFWALRKSYSHGKLADMRYLEKTTALNNQTISKTLAKFKKMGVLVIGINEEDKRNTLYGLKHSVARDYAELLLEENLAYMEKVDDWLSKDCTTKVLKTYLEVVKKGTAYLFIAGLLAPNKL